MRFRDERAAPEVGLPPGLYWGVTASFDHPWKIDLWGLEEAEIERRLEAERVLERRLTPETRRAILEIKSRVHSLPG